jgi:putative FmdB family regulatory protein
MPTYTYRCRECDHEFEKRQRMSDPPLTVCPVCKGEVRRVVSSVGIVFKGSGFYVTDNRNGSSANGSGKSGSVTKDKAEEAVSSKADDGGKQDKTEKSKSKKTAEATA